jgi:hypothetical protein
MADVRKFVTSVQERYGMRPVVPFEQPIEIGDIGTLGPDGAWNPVSTTRRRFSVAPTGIRTTRDGSGVWSASSGKDVSFKAYAEGEVSQLVSSVADARARAEITFESSSSFVFAAKNVTIRSATEVGDVIEAIRRSYHERDRRPESERWYKEYVFVFGVGDADAFTAMLANRKGTTVAVTASGKVGPVPITPAALAAGINIGISSNELTKISETRAKGRFYRAYRLVPSILTRWDDEAWSEVRGILATDVPPTPGFADTFEEPQTTPVT